MSRNVILWVTGFAGLLLLYAAYKNEKPLALLTGLGGSTGSGSGGGPAGPAGAVPVPGQPGHVFAPGDGHTGGPVTSFGGIPVGPVVYDQNGNQVDVPLMYASNPANYIPGTVST